MPRKYQIRIGLALTFLALVLAGCSPKPDVTDPLSDYSVSVNVPFATASANQTVVPQTGPTINPAQPVKIVGWMNESLEASQQDAYDELTVGSIGTAVKNLQKRLIELGYMTGTASGSFDQATAQAVRLFEAAYGRTATGVATPLMQVYLFANNAKIYNGASVKTTQSNGTSADQYTLLQRGDTGSAVTRLQNRLRELGYMAASANGVFDANTETAVKAFEAAYNRQRTGIATVALQQTLYSSSALRAGAATPTPAFVQNTAALQITEKYKVLQLGSKGDEVKRLQERLRELGYMTSKADGIYGQDTVAAVKAFEAAYGKKQTGIAYSEMQKYLYADDALRYGTATPAPTAAAGYSTLVKGSYGESVVKLQKRLIELGYLKGKADGYFGDDTDAAVRAFEARYGNTQTGVATATLQQYLFDERALSYSSSMMLETNYEVLKEGSYGTSVLALQVRLIELNYLTGTADGYYGTATAQAVRQFEAAYGKAETGVASVALQEKLYSDDAIKNVVFTPDTSSYTKLKKGDRGDKVAKLQLRLIELGYLTGTVDGTYGEGTANAVKAFEAAYGQNQTGIASATLQSFLFAEDALPNPAGNVAVSYSVLEKGDSGQLVKNLQKRLIALGYLEGSADGIYGAATVSAVKAFQKQVGLNQTGTASAAVQQMLYASDAPHKASSSLETVNRPARVAVEQAYVYADTGDAMPTTTFKKGVEVTVLRTRGNWAEVKTGSGTVVYMSINDLTYEMDDSENTGLTGVITQVNASAVINTEQVIVYDSPKTSGKVLATLSRGTTVTWTRVNGAWAEIKNSGGNTGYVLAEFLSLTSNTGESDGLDDLFYSTLKNGDKGESVKKLQTRLKKLGYFAGTIGGNYLTITTNAVKDFQKAIGMKETGVATPELQEIIFSKYAPKKGAYGNSTARSLTRLTLGDTGEYVQEMQLKLVSLGYLDSSSVKFGTYDSATRNAIIDVQLTIGASGTDGTASPELQCFLLSKASAALKR